MEWKWALFLIIWNGHELERIEPSYVDWWTCRIGELRQSAGWQGNYAGHPIIGAVCLRQEERLALRQCETVRTCA